MKKTLENLAKAFIGESQARNRYTFYAKVAQKEGYEQIGGIFMETAEQEKIHAKRLFEHIQEVRKALTSRLPSVARGDEVLKVEAEVPNVYGTTEENLEAAINGETYEFETMYPEFAKIADEEGLTKIAARLNSIAKAEKHHAERYAKLLENLKAGIVFKRNDEVIWVCRECGYVHVGKTPPEKCPSCDHPQSYYQVQCENY